MQVFLPIVHVIHLLLSIHLFQLLVQLLYELKKPAPETLQSIF